MYVDYMSVFNFLSAHYCILKFAIFFVVVEIIQSYLKSSRSRSRNRVGKFNSPGRHLNLNEQFVYELQ